MLSSYVLHWCLDMSGAVSLACILRGCQNPRHQHRWITRWLIAHPWLTQSLIAVVMAIATVHAVG